MPTLEERVTRLEERVNTMDTDLKHHFTEFRAFVVETIGGVEKRLTAKLAEVDSRLSSRLDGVDSKLDTLLSRVPRRLRPRRRRRPS